MYYVHSILMNLTLAVSISHQAPQDNLDGNWSD